MLMDILNGQMFKVKSISGYDQINEDGFYIFDDSPSTLTYFNFVSSIIGLKPNKHGLVLNGWIDFDSCQCIDQGELLAKVKIWADNIEADKQDNKGIKL